MFYGWRMRSWTFSREGSNKALKGWAQTINTRFTKQGKEKKPGDGLSMREHLEGKLLLEGAR